MTYEVSVHELFWLDAAETRLCYESVSFGVADHFDKVFDETFENLQ